MSFKKVLNKIFNFQKEDENLTAEEYYEIGFDFLVQNEIEKAKYAFEKSIEINSYFVKSYNQLYQIYLRLKDYNNAIKYLEKIKTIQNDAHVYFELGKLYFQLENLELSYKNFHLSFTLDLKARFDIDEYVNNAKELILKVLLDIAKENDNNYDIKIICYEKIVQLFPQEYQYVFDIAVIYYENLKYDLALQYLNRLTRNTKEFPNAYLYLGYIYKSRTNFNSAIENFEEYLKKDPKNSDAIVNYAICLYETGKSDIAIQYFNRSIEIDPKNITAYIYLSKVYLEKKDFEIAEKVLRNGLVVDPNNLELKQHLALILYNSNNYTQSIQFFNDIVKEQPENIKAQDFLGKSYIKNSDYDNAIKRYHEIIKLDPKYFKAYSSLGLVHKKKETI